MLTINDLHQEQGLSSSDMRKVAGGTPIIINNPTVQLDGSGSPGFTMTASQLYTLAHMVLDSAAAAARHHT